MNSLGKSPFGEMTDFELLLLYKTEGNHEALAILLSRCQPLIHSRIRYFGFNANDEEDLQQECLFGLFSAINSFDSQKSSFATFSRICVDRMLISFLRKRNRACAIPAETLVELTEENEALAMTTVNDPLFITECLDNFEELVANIKSVLSNLEFSVVLRSFRGMSYSEIADDLKISKKSVDNAVQRIRKKFSSL